MGGELRLEEIGGGLAVEVSREHGFGMDAVLLAAFAAPKPDECACDLGTGCGIIPLLWCRRQPPIQIDALEIQLEAADMARRCVKSNRLESRITVHAADLRDWRAVLQPCAYDVVTMNPPYFARGSGGLSRSQAARIARHEGEGCSFSDVAGAAYGLIRPGGRFCFCHRPERLPYVLDVLKSAGLSPRRLGFVHATPQSKPSLFLCEAGRGSFDELKVLPPFLLNDYNGKPTLEYKSLYDT